MLKWQLSTAFCLVLSLTIGPVRADVPDTSIGGDPITSSSWQCSAQALSATDNLLDNGGFDDPDYTDSQDGDVTSWYADGANNHASTFIGNSQTEHGGDQDGFSYLITNDGTNNVYQIVSGVTDYAPLHYIPAVQSTPGNYYSLSFLYGRAGFPNNQFEGPARLQIVWNGKIVATADVTAATNGGVWPTTLKQYCVPALLLGTGADTLVIYAQDYDTTG